MATTPVPTTTNSLVKLTKFFGVSLAEFQAFWKTCTEDEKKQFRAEIDKWDGISEYIS